MTKEYEGSPQPNPEIFKQIDAIHQWLETDPRRAFELYSQAGPEVQKLIATLRPSEGMIPQNSKIDVDLIMTYIIFKLSGSELGMKGTRRKCNPETKLKIEEIDNQQN